MENPVQVEALRKGRQRHPIFKFMGERYYKRKRYYCNAKDELLHRNVWIAFHGPISDKHVIHHKDYDGANNCIENLECIEASNHGEMHSMQPGRREQAAGCVHFAIAAAAQWRKDNPELATAISLKAAEGRRRKLASTPKKFLDCTWCG